MKNGIFLLLLPLLVATVQNTFADSGSSISCSGECPEDAEAGPLIVANKNPALKTKDAVDQTIRRLNLICNGMKTEQDKIALLTKQIDKANEEYYAKNPKGPILSRMTYFVHFPWSYQCDHSSGENPNLCWADKEFVDFRNSINMADQDIAAQPRNKSIEAHGCKIEMDHAKEMVALLSNELATFQKAIGK